VDIVERALIKEMAPVAIDLEITESLIMEDVESTIEKLKRVQAIGIKIAIDDFGTGYSSLAYLAKLPVKTLKIDRSFVITMLKDIDTATLVQTVITLAHSLKLTVVAEGVDAEEQAKVLRLLRCDQTQGYLFSKPLPAMRSSSCCERQPRSGQACRDRHRRMRRGRSWRRRCSCAVPPAPAGDAACAEFPTEQ
jgi:EAL domain-containing protein (putative c-di-GMP-specific phosphodiesterase class I)